MSQFCILLSTNFLFLEKFQVFPVTYPTKLAADLIGTMVGKRRITYQKLPKSAKQRILAAMNSVCEMPSINSKPFKTFIRRVNAIIRGRYVSLFL